MTAFRSLKLGRFLAPFLLLLPLAFAAPPTVDDFVRRPEVSGAQISEDGRYVSFLTPSAKDYFDLNIYDVRTKESKKFNLGGDDVLEQQWVDGENLLLVLQRRPDYWARWVLFNVPQGKVTENVSYQGQYFQLQSKLRAKPNHFVVWFPDDRQGSPGLAVINTRLRPKAMAGQDNSRFNVESWIDIPPGEFHCALTDLEGEVRMVLLYHKEKLRFHYRRSPADKWAELPFDHEFTSVLATTDDPDHLYIAHYSPEAHSSRLHRYHVSTGDFGPALYEDRDYSLTEANVVTLRQAPGRSRPIFLSYHRDLPTQLALDPEVKKIQAVINAKFPGHLVRIADTDRELRHVIVAVTNGREPSRYAIYDVAAQSFLPLPAPTPWFKPAAMSVMRPIKFKTRDGLTLEAYLALPPAVAGQKPPLVVFPHGGPWVRDTWGFNEEAQFLTSRGYAVLQPNYRGSLGYSRAVSKDEAYEFRKMHDDVTDAVRHVVTQGWVDEKRLAISGASFGGYLAIAGVAFEPELYKCAVTFAGVFDWKQLIRQLWANTDNDQFNYDYLLKKLGDPAKQTERFDAMSPLNHVAAIRVPVYVIHGEADQTVDIGQSNRLLAKLTEHKVPHEKLIFSTEVHGFIERENRKKYYEALERFLAKHL